ncbi:MAG: hypothetical protein QM757_26210 [Paludibaculum sp.]
MASHLEDEPAVPPLVKQLIFRQSPDGKTAQDERPGIEAKRLGGLLPVLPDQLNPLCLFELLFRYDQVWAGPLEYRSGGLKTRVVELRQNDHLVARSGRVIKASFGGSKQGR